MSKVIMGNGGFHGCLIEPQGVSAWWKQTAQKHAFPLSRSLLLNHFEPQSSKTKLLLPIMPIDIVEYASTLLWDNLCRNNCICRHYRALYGVCRSEHILLERSPGYLSGESGYHQMRVERRIRFEYATYGQGNFWTRERKICGFKNIWIRVDRA